MGGLAELEPLIQKLSDHNGQHIPDSTRISIEITIADLKLLPHKIHIVMYLYYIIGLKEYQIGNVLGMTQQNINLIKRIGITKLRKLLKKQ